MTAPTLPPPENLVLEIPGRPEGCPTGCRHCLHRNVVRPQAPDLTEGQVADLLAQGRAMGIPHLQLYPHSDDVSFLPADRILPLFAHAARLGYRVKTVTNGANPDTVERLLPTLYRLAISVDALDRETYGELRPKGFHDAMLETLARVRAARARHPELRVHALAMVDRRTLDGVERRVAELVDLDLFHKIKLLELLPLGEARPMAGQSLRDPAALERLAALRARYADRVRIGTPLWRVRAGGQRGCRLGSKDLVVGPQGQLAGCALLFYLNRLVGEARAQPLAEAWTMAFAPFRDRAARPVPAVCRDCALHERDLCWGGCLARRLVFGDQVEIARSCGVRDRASSLALLARHVA